MVAFLNFCDLGAGPQRPAPATCLTINFSSLVCGLAGKLASCQNLNSLQALACIQEPSQGSVFIEQSPPPTKREAGLLLVFGS